VNSLLFPYLVISLKLEGTAIIGTAQAYFGHTQQAMLHRYERMICFSRLHACFKLFTDMGKLFAKIVA
jgi:hypothetical protein